MSNPKNLCSFGGIIDDVSITYNREGNIHYVEFTLKIARNFLNKGEQRFDYPRCRYSKSDVFQSTLRRTERQQFCTKKFKKLYKTA